MELEKLTKSLDSLKFFMSLEDQDINPDQYAVDTYLWPKLNLTGKG